LIGVAPQAIHPLWVKKPGLLRVFFLQEHCCCL
jgi:hypothetical protein